MKHGEAIKLLETKGVEWLCDRITEGESMRAIARGLKLDVSNLSRWVSSDDARALRVREARVASAQAFDEMALEVLQGRKYSDAMKREIASHYRWKAKMMNPGVYGDRVQAELTGAGGGPITHSITVEFVGKP